MDNAWRELTRVSTPVSAISSPSSGSPRSFCSAITDEVVGVRGLVSLDEAEDAGVVEVKPRQLLSELEAVLSPRRPSLLPMATDTPVTAGLRRLCRAQFAPKVPSLLGPQPPQPPLQRGPPAPAKGWGKGKGKAVAFMGKGKCAVFMNKDKTKQAAIGLDKIKQVVSGGKGKGCKGSGKGGKCKGFPVVTKNLNKGKGQRSSGCASGKGSSMASRARAAVPRPSTAPHQAMRPRPTMAPHLVASLCTPSPLGPGVIKGKGKSHREWRLSWGMAVRKRRSDRRQ